jgi:hypothetical protein
VHTLCVAFSKNPEDQISDLSTRAVKRNGTHGAGRSHIKEAFLLLVTPVKGVIYH